ncbi:MAG: ATP synthase F1 subunit gamma [Planctomycetales bacterium]|nr:ATP synthase F1 subunit gamma [Planctomycetales bacterium]
MANARALDKRRKSVRNIRKITRTMELIATARFKKAMDRASAATAYTNQITKLVSDLSKAGLEVSHPLLEQRTSTNKAVLLVLTANRGLCGGYNGNVQRAGLRRWNELQAGYTESELEVSGKRGIGAFKYRGVIADRTYMQFEDKTRYEEVEELADRYLEAYTLGEVDRLDVAYTKFENVARQYPVVETLLPLGSLDTGDEDEAAGSGGDYEFFPSAESVLKEVVPASFKIKLFKCFLDAAVSEQVSRMVAMKGATENAGELIKQLSMTYNRARQSQITGEIMEIIGGVEALNK